MVKSVQRMECILDNVLGGQLETTVLRLRSVLSEVLSFVRGSDGTFKSSVDTCVFLRICKSVVSLHSKSPKPDSSTKL